MFPVNSTSVETAQVKRILRVMQRTKIAHDIAYAGVFNCRRERGGSDWSQHAWGNAADLFPKAPSGDDDEQRRWIMHTLVMQATRRTIANRGRKLPIALVIDHDGRLYWTPATSYRAYDGVLGDHVHVAGAPLRTGTPPCA